MKNAIAILALVVMTALSMLGQTQGQLASRGTTSGLPTLKVASHNDPTGAFPQSRLYTLMVVNTTGHELVLDAVKMPGGYVGEGTFFPCAIEESRGRKWAVVVRHDDLKEIGPNPPTTKVSVAPGQSVEVCRSMLPHEGARRGALVRFVLSRKWQSRSPGDVLASKPFEVGR